MAMRPRSFGGANNSTGNRQRGVVVRPVYEDFKPKSEWIQDLQSDNLLIYLPGFTKESLKVSTEGRNTIKVRGERLVTRNKWQRFQEDFHAPDYCNLKGTHARFAGEILTIIVPKNTITPPHPKEESKPIDKPTTSQELSEIQPAKPPQIPKDPLTQNVKETIPPKSTALKQDDKEKVVQESTIPPKPISPVPSKVPKESISQKVNDPMSQKGPSTTTSPNESGKAKPLQESPVSPSQISPVSDDKRQHDQIFSKQEKLPKESDVEQKKKVDSGASKHQETMSETKAQHGHVEMQKNKRVPELMDAEEAAKRRKIMDAENSNAKPEFVEKNIQGREKKEGQKTAIVDEDEATFRNKTATNSGTELFGLGNFKKAVRNLAELDEERKLLVNMGAGVLVFMALGAYIYHAVKN